MLHTIRRQRRHKRHGAIAVLAAVTMVVFLVMLAFSIDYGYLLASRSELQRAADAAALAAVQDLIPAADGSQNIATARASLRSYVRDNLDNSSFAVPDSDIETGRFDTDSIYSGVSLLNSGIHDTVRVTLRRDGANNPLVSLFFARALGVSNAPIQVTATAALQKPRRLIDGSGVLPFAVPLDEWEDLEYGDAWAIYGDGQITDADGDSIPGNWGTLDIGASNNSTSDISDQIQNGLDKSHLDSLYSDNRIPDSTHIDTTDQIWLNGDPGLSSGMHNSIGATVGQTRVIPLYDSMTAQGGNNQSYHVVSWAVVKVVHSNFQGSNKHIVVQRAYGYDGTLVPSTDLGNTDGIAGAFTSPVLIE